MFITEVKLIKSDAPLVNKKIKLCIIMGIMFLLSGLISIGALVYFIINKTTDYSPYLFTAFALLISIVWILIVVGDYKKFSKVFSELMENGSATLNTNQVINAQKKINTGTIINFVCAGIVFVCAVLTIVFQIIKFNPVNFSYIALLFPLLNFLIYQSFSLLITDKLYRNCIFDDKK